MRLITILAVLLLAVSPAFGQLLTLPAQTFTATGQVGSQIPLVPGYASATISVSGPFSSVTVAITASNDGGLTWFPILVSPVTSPVSSSTTIAATGPGLYVADVSGLTNVKFQTVGTFAGTSVSVKVTFSNGGGLMGKGGGSSSACGAISFITPTATSSPYNVTPQGWNPATAHGICRFEAVLRWGTAAGNFFFFASSAPDCSVITEQLTPTFYGVPNSVQQSIEGSVISVFLTPPAGASLCLASTVAPNAMNTEVLYVP